MLSPDTRKLYYTPHVLPELKKSIEAVCIHRANAKAINNQETSEARRLLVTGGCGFIGSNFINHWLETYPDDSVINIDRLDPCSNIRNIENADSPKYTLVVANINNKDFVLHLMKQYNITHIVHFAGKNLILFFFFCFYFICFKYKLILIHHLVIVLLLLNQMYMVHIVS